MHWQEVIDNPHLRDLPFRIELNRWGNVEMSPASNHHVQMQALVARTLETRGGLAMQECSVQTSDGVRVPDVAWGDTAFWKQAGRATPYPMAAPICVEVISPSNTLAEMQHKIALYLEAGAREVWLVDLEGQARFFDATGEVAQSQFGFKNPVA